MRIFLGRDWISPWPETVVDPAWISGGEALRAFWEVAIAGPEQDRQHIGYPWFREFPQVMRDRGWSTWFATLGAWGRGRWLLPP